MPANCLEKAEEGQRFSPGVRYVTERKGDGLAPKPGEATVLKVRAWRLDERKRILDENRLEMFPSTTPGLDAQFLKAVIFAESMRRGERRMVWSDTRIFGGVGLGLPAGKACFVVELSEIVPAKPNQPLPAVPVGYDEAPPEARVLSSGLRYVSVTPGATGVRPEPDDVVEVEISAWYLEGESRGYQPMAGKTYRAPIAKLPMVAEVVPLMAVEETLRVWIPAGKGITAPRGRPFVPMVAEVRLVSVAQTQ